MLAPPVSDRAATSFISSLLLFHSSAKMASRTAQISAEGAEGTASIARAPPGSCLPRVSILR